MLFFPPSETTNSDVVSVIAKKAHISDPRASVLGLVLMGQRLHSSVPQDRCPQSPGSSRAFQEMPMIAFSG